MKFTESEKEIGDTQIERSFAQMAQTKSRQPFVVV